MTKPTPSESTQAPDRELLRDYTESGDQAAFRVLVERYEGLVRSVARRTGLHAAQAEDCAQETFALFAQKAATLSPEVILAGWFQRTALNLSRAEQRRESRRQFRENASHEPLETNEDSPRVSTQANELASNLDNAVDELQTPYHEAISLCYLRGLSQRAAAAELGCSESALSKRLRKALVQLRRNLARRGVKVSSAALLAFFIDLDRPAASGTEADLAAPTKSLSQPWTLKIAFLSGAAASLFLVFSLGWNRSSNSPDESETQIPNAAAVASETRPEPITASPTPSTAASTELIELEAIFTELLRAMLQRDAYQSWETMQAAEIPIGFEPFSRVREEMGKAFDPISFLKTWSSIEPIAALDWAISITEKSPLFSVIRPPLENYYALDPTAASRYVSDLVDTHPLKAEALAWLALREKPYAWAEQVESMPPSPERQIEFRSLSVALAAEDPAKAAEWVQRSQLTNEEKRELLTFILPILGEKEPALAIMHMERLGDYADVATALPRMAERIARAFPDQAPAFYQTFQSPEFYANAGYRNSVIRSVGSGLAQANPSDAIDWMQELPKTDQAQALSGILTQIQSPELLETAETTLRDRSNPQPRNALLAILPQLPFDAASQLFDNYLESEGIEVFGEKEKALVETLSGHLSQFALRGEYEEVSEYILTKQFDPAGKKALLLIHPALFWSFADHESLLAWLDEKEASYPELIPSVRESASRLQASVTLDEGKFNFSFSSRKQNATTDPAP